MSDEHRPLDRAEEAMAAAQAAVAEHPTSANLDALAAPRRAAGVSTETVRVWAGRFEQLASLMEPGR